MQGTQTSTSTFFHHLPSRMSKVRRQRDSEEIAVFEATRYFSGGVVDGEHLGLGSGVREERVMLGSGASRRSLDTFAKAKLPQQYYYYSRKGESGQSSMDKKIKQPSSTGGKLASFINSLFKQATYKKRSKAFTSIESDKGRNFEEKHEAGRRKSKKGLSVDQKLPAHFCRDSCGVERVRSADCCAGGGERGKLMEKEASRWSEELREREEYVCNMRKEEEDEGWSESSSDLFELKSYDLSDLSSDLPVYGSPILDAVRRGASIDTVAFVVN